MIRVAVGFKFGELGYIGSPYWPERNTIIDIAKNVHPKLGDAKKQDALRASCEKHGITIEQYEEMVEKAERPFYTLNGSRDSEIVIPERVFQSFLNHASMKAPKAIPRIPEKGLTFIGVRVENGHFLTGKTEQDAAKFERFVKMAESNQRSFASDLYIHDFTARGVILLEEDVIQHEQLQKLTEYGGKWCGLGSARPQGYGRFHVVQWEATELQKAA